MKKYFLYPLLLVIFGCTTDSSIDAQIDKYMEEKGQAKIESVLINDLQIEVKKTDLASKKPNKGGPRGTQNR